MTHTPRHLRKPDVEALLAAAGGPTSSALEEATVVREALRPALGRVLGLPDGTPWPELVDAAAAAGGWPPARTGLVAAAERPDRVRDTEAVVEALWDLVTELNERRTLRPD
jgi:hypothetical protein